MRTMNIVKANPNDPEVVARHEKYFGKPAKEKAARRAMRVGGRNQNPIEADRTDILPWMLYDRLTTAQAANTATEYRFFTNPISATKTKADTNLEQVSQLTAPEHFNCTSLRFYFSSNMYKVDIDTFLNTYYCEFWIGSSKIYAEGPLQLFPGGSGLYAMSTQNNVGAWSNGMPNPHCVVDFRMGDNPIGHHILQGENFYVKVIGTAFTLAATPAPGLNLMCVLEGIKSRGVR